MSYVRVLFERFFSPFWHNSLLEKKNNDNNNNNKNNNKDNDSDNYNNNDYNNDNDNNNNKNSNCGELCLRQTCLNSIGLEISPDVSRTSGLAFMPFISTADHYQAGSNTNLRNLCEFFGFLSPFWSGKRRQSVHVLKCKKILTS